MKSKRRAWVIGGLLAVAVVGLGVLAWVDEGPLYWWVMTKQRLDRLAVVSLSPPWETESEERGWHRVKRWDEKQWHGIKFMWDLKTGFMTFRQEWRHGRALWGECWTPDGTLRKQLTYGPNGIEEEAEEPPWLWETPEQSAPSAPAWILDDKQWQAALDAPK